MPEGDAVRRLADTFDQVFVGERLQVSSPQGRFSASAALIDGQVLAHARPVGKHLFLGFVPVGSHAGERGTTAGQGETLTDLDVDAGDIDTWIHIHLGLYGWWRFNGDSSVDDRGHGVVRRNSVRVGPKDRHRPMKWGGGAMNADEVTGQPGALPAVSLSADSMGSGSGAGVETSGGCSASDDVWEAPEPVGQVRLRLLAGHAVADLAGPTRCELITDAERRVAEAKLGPDPLRPGARDDADACARFVAAVRRSKRPIGELLMDQSVLAGVGNIYRADVLFLAGITPMRQGVRVSAARLKELWVMICDVMRRGYEAGYLITMDPKDAPDEPIPGDEEASRWYVYHRTGRACMRCGSTIAEKQMQGRRLFWCPGCQR